MNKAEVGKLLDMLAARYPQTRAFTESTLDVWHGDLANIPVEAVNAVLPGVMKSSPDFMPSLPKIMGAIEDVVHPRLDATTAWAAVRSAMLNSIGNYGPSGNKARRLLIEKLGPEHGSLAADAADAVGWESMYNQGDERAMPRFIKALEHLQKNADRTETLAAIGTVTYPEIDE